MVEEETGLLAPDDFGFEADTGLQEDDWASRRGAEEDLAVAQVEVLLGARLDVAAEAEDESEGAGPRRALSGRVRLRRTPFADAGGASEASFLAGGVAARDTRCARLAALVRRLDGVSPYQCWQCFAEPAHDLGGARQPRGGVELEHEGRGVAVEHKARPAVALATDAAVARGLRIEEAGTAGQRGLQPRAPPGVVGGRGLAGVQHADADR